MKLEYYEWTCLVCGDIARFTGRDIFSPFPRWFTIETEGNNFSNEYPRFSSVVCSFDCLKGAHIVVENYVLDGGSISRKKEIDATICDFCGKIYSYDKANPVIGGNQSSDWIKENSSAGSMDFCSRKCQHEYHKNMEKAFSKICDFDKNPLDKRILLASIDLPNLKKSFKDLKDRMFSVGMDL